MAKFAFLVKMILTALSSLVSMAFIILALCMSICLSMYFICADLKGGLYVNVKLHFFQLDHLDLWPMTLTIKLVRTFMKVDHCTKFCDRMSISSAVRVFTH